MASITDTHDEYDPCKIKFHWRKTVSCEASSIKLVVTSLTGTSINLHWVPKNRDFESEVTPLPVGLHSGYILIEDDKLSSNDLQYPVSQAFLKDDTIEKEFKVDPFFASTKKKSIELFIDKRSFESWRETPSLRLRYLSSGNISGQKCVSDRRKWQSNNELCLQFQEDSVNERVVPEDSSVSEETPSRCIRDVPTNLRKWSSLGGEKAPSRRSFDSSYYSKSRSIAGDDLTKSRESITGITPSRSDGDKVNSEFICHFPVNKTQKSVLSDSDLNFLKFQTYKQAKDLQCLLDSSDSDKDQDVSPKEKGYGCLITLESRSASMDDVGSPRALEEVLVSLTSSGTTEAIVAQLYEVQTSPKPLQDLEVSGNSDCSVPTSSIQENSVYAPEESSEVEETESRDFQSEYSLNDDVNFQYDSIDDNNESIPLNIESLLESESSRAHQDGPPQSLEVVHTSSSGEETDKNYCSELDASNVGYYEIISKNGSESSAKGEVATDSIRLVPQNHLTIPRFASEVTSSKNSTRKSSKHHKKRYSDSSSSKSSKMYSRNTRPHTSTVRPMIGRPLSESIGTQTTSRIDPLKDRRAKNLTKCTQSYFYAPSIADGTFRKDFTPLPSKADGPWSTKRRGDTTFQHFGNSDLKNLQKNLYNLIKADKILRKIHDVQDGMLQRCGNPAPRSSVRFSEPLHRRRSQPNLDYSSHSSTLENRSPERSGSSQRFRNAIRSDFANDDFVATHPNIYGLDRPFYPPSKLRSSQTSRYLRNMASMPDLTSDVSDHVPFDTKPQMGSRSKSMRHLDSFPLSNKRPNGTSRRRLTTDRNLKSSKSSAGFLDMEDSLDSDSSDDSLIDEINCLRKNMDISNSSLLDYPKTYSRTRHRSHDHRRSSIVPFRSGYTMPTPPPSESSVGAIVRARSESDLQLVGPLTDGYKGEPPYLPYRKEQLSLGQVVKVLVPGGVSLARVVYTPSNARVFPNYKPDTEKITVVLISEPTKMIGSIINVPLNQILLAWPKTRNIINF